MKKNVKKNISSFFDRMTHNAAAAEGMGTFMKLKNVVDKMHGNRFADNVRALWRKPQATKIQTLNKQIAEVTEKLNLKRVEVKNALEDASKKNKEWLRLQKTKKDNFVNAVCNGKGPSCRQEILGEIDVCNSSPTNCSYNHRYEKNNRVS